MNQQSKQQPPIHQLPKQQPPLQVHKSQLFFGILFHFPLVHFCDLWAGFLRLPHFGYKLFKAVLISERMWSSSMAGFTSYLTVPSVYVPHQDPIGGVRSPNSSSLDHRGSARLLRCFLRNISSTSSYSTISQAPRPVPFTPLASQDSNRSSLTDLQSFRNQ